MIPDLRARTRRLDRDIDPLAVAGADGFLFSRDRVGFAGRGIAARVDRDDIAGVLAGIEVVSDEVDRPGSGPIAFGALPFTPGAPAELTIPEVVVGRGGDGTRWVTTVWPTDVDEPDPAAILDRRIADTAGPPPPGPSEFTVRSDRPPAEWIASVAEATARIRAGELDKVVLARRISVEADSDIPVDLVLLRLSRAFPDCFLYLVDGICGASPELLVGRAGDVVQSHPMAGSAPRRGDPAEDRRLAANLLASSTYRHEHQVTVDAVHDGLLGFSSYVDYEPEPSVVALANVQHLATRVEGRLSHPPASVLELVDALHPTPAVCGRPRDAALAVIDELEGLDRDRYAGAVGWVDAAGNGRFAIALRGATIEGRSAGVIAGVGLVGDSDPDTELIETRAKLQAMLNVLVRP